MLDSVRETNPNRNFYDLGNPNRNWGKSRKIDNV